VLVGSALAVLVAASAPLIPIIVTSDERVRDALPLVLLILAIGLPLAGLVFVLDGVLIGAGDGRYLAVTGILNLIVHLVLLVLAAGAGLPALLAAFTFGYLGARAVTLGARARGDRWIVTGAR